MIASFYSQMDRYAYALVAVETSLVTAMLLAYLLPVQKHYKFSNDQINLIVRFGQEESRDNITNFQ